MSPNVNVVKVPEWNCYYPALENTTPEQREFFVYWGKELRRGNALDLQGNVSYVFAYIYLLIWKFIKEQNIETLIADFKQVEEFYANLAVGKKSKVTNYLKTWEKDACLLVKDYDSYWQHIQNIDDYKLSVEEIINFRTKCKNTSLISSDIFKLLGGRQKLPKFAREHINEVSQFMDDYLKEFHRRHGKNFVEYLYTQFNSENLTEDDFGKLRAFFSNEKHFTQLKTFYQEQRSIKQFTVKSYLFSGVLPPPVVTKHFIDIPDLDAVCTLTSQLRSEMPSVEIKDIPIIISESIKNQLKRKIKEYKK